MGQLTVKTLTDIVDHFSVDGDNFNVFLETGTYLGETVEELQPYFLNIHTIEISEYLFNRYKQEHNDYDNVTIHLGDSSYEIPNVLKELNKDDNTIFWLDGHFSSGMTSKGNKDCPLIEECKSIDTVYKSNEAIILIDDYTLFGTTDEHDWKDITIENIEKCFDNFDVELYEYSKDILCLYIKRK
tara:strand:- start:791 stop:1345 length:555 start_codon:yes stop_codon:yes gene_type:complete